MKYRISQFTDGATVLSYSTSAVLGAVILSSCTVESGLTSHDEDECSGSSCRLCHSNKESGKK